MTTGKQACALQTTTGFGSGLNFSLNTVEKRNFCYLPKDMTPVGCLSDQMHCNLDFL